MSSISDYKSIAKANVLFGGVRLYTILLGIIRSKLVAVILGAEGMGIMGLLLSTTDLVNSATNMGLGASAVRDVALAHSSHDSLRVSSVYSVISKLVWLTGILGTVLVLFFARQLSNYAFSSDEYTTAFRMISIVLLINQLTVAKTVMLQGLRKLQYMAKGTVWGSTIGLLLTIPLYYLYGQKAIVPSIIISSLISYGYNLFFFRKVRIEKVKIHFYDVLSLGKPMIILGVMLSLTGFMDVMQAYIIRTQIAQIGGTAEVGLYNAGYGLISSYVGLVFSSIGTDYYPRLSSVSDSPRQYNEIVNNQMELMLLVLVPLVILYIAFSKELIVILYTKEFLPVKVMTNLLAVGMILRAISWCPGFLYVAKGDKTLYFTIYIIEFSISTTLYIFLYHCYGLVGIGVAFVIQYVIGSISAMIITRLRYKYVLRRNTAGVVFFSMLFVCVGLGLALAQMAFSSMLMGLWIAFSFWYSYRELDKRVDLGSLLGRLLSRVSVKNK